MPKTSIKPTAKAAKRPRVDWEAVERDFRTGKYTLRELGEKHNVSHAAVGKRSRDKQWDQDLGRQIRQATNAKLTAELVSNEVDKNVQEVSTTVQIAAELNKQIILGHRARLVELASAVDKAKDKLLALGEEVADIREAGVFVAAVNNIAGATKTLLEQERKAFGLEDAQQENPGDGGPIQHEVKVKFV
jgi:hypothetical protein